MLIFAVILCLILPFFIYKIKHVPIPKVNNLTNLDEKKIEKKDATYYKSSFIKQPLKNLYEVYVEGAAYDRGIAVGALLQDVKFEHEKAFVESIHSLVPNKFHLQLLKIIVGFINRNLHKKIDNEFLEEIYGMSHFSSKQFNYIAPPYQRVLNYHAAHDIGHALQNIGLVGCSSFVVNQHKSSDNQLLLARNLDFSPSEGFNERKVLYFINPEKGHKFISYSWPGFSGVVSGMNEFGLCVVLHAAKSSATLKIGTPVSIIAREIMQFAKNIEEARAILQKRRSFVSEFFLVASALDKTATVFEKVFEELTEYNMQGNELICVNHFLSSEKKDQKSNIEWKNTISSAYREGRLKELLANYNTINPFDAAAILRDVRGQKNENIGLQNENAINQLGAHHAIIFKPLSKEFWISTTHYMLGEMIAYNFDEAFEKCQTNASESLSNSKNNVLADSFIESSEYVNFEKYKKLKIEIRQAIKDKKALSKNVLDELESSNPLLFSTYELLGDYFVVFGENELARDYFMKSLNCNLPTQFDLNRIKKKLSKC